METENVARLMIQVGSPRAGSTNLERILQSSESVEPFGEIFNRAGGMDDSNTATFLDFKGIAYDDMPKARVLLRSIVRRDPIAACEDFLAFAESRNAEFAEFKLFPGFLPASMIDSIVRRFRPVGITLYRTPIDVFISFEKARLLGKWRRVDTTDITPEIRAADFAFWKWKQQNLYQMADYIFRRNNLPMLIIRYEEMYEDGVDPVDYVLKKFREFSVDLKEPSQRIRFMGKQDRSDTNKEKVSNWDSFIAECREKHIESELEQYQFSGVDTLLWAQLNAERVLPVEARRKLASVVHGVASSFKR